MEGWKQVQVDLRAAEVHQTGPDSSVHQRRIHGRSLRDARANRDRSSRPRRIQPVSIPACDALQRRQKVWQQSWIRCLQHHLLVSLKCNFNCSPPWFQFFIHFLVFIQKTWQTWQNVFRSLQKIWRMSKLFLTRSSFARIFVLEIIW